MKRSTAALLCAVLFFAGCGRGGVTEYEGASDLVPAEESFSEAEASGNAAAENIFVYICGAVDAPGVYELPAGSRVFEAVQAAGGLTSEADPRSLNQAKLLSDGEQITVLTEEETADNALSVSSGTSADDGTVDINTADADALMTLPGVGEARARAIIEYRETYGAFAEPRDICNVAGIKEKLFARIESLIRV